MQRRWRVYLVQCSDNSYYCGVTTDMDRRLKEHNCGKGARYTKSRAPVKLVAQSQPMEKGKALSLEARIKKSRRENKLEQVRDLGWQV